MTTPCARPMRSPGKSFDNLCKQMKETYGVSTFIGHMFAVDLLMVAVKRTPADGFLLTCNQ